jgi:hypothetical protein
MEHRTRITTCVATLAFAMTLVLVTPALGDDASSIEWSTMLEARERSMAVRPDPTAGLDPAIRTAITSRTAETSAAPTAVVSAPAVGDEFAWGAAALGLGAGIAAMCFLLGCVTLVRSHGRLRSV